jgi:hypothetical protein
MINVPGLMSLAMAQEKLLLFGQNDGGQKKLN